MGALFELVSGWPLAVVWLHSTDRTQHVTVPAAAVFDLPDGFAAVHPGYIDPFNASHRLHRVAARVSAFLPGAQEVPFEGPLWWGTIERYIGSRVQRSEVGQTLEAYPEEVHKLGRSLAEERAWLIEALGKELGL